MLNMLFYYNVYDFLLIFIFNHNILYKTKIYTKKSTIITKKFKNVQIKKNIK